MIAPEHCLENQQETQGNIRDLLLDKREQIGWGSNKGNALTTHTSQIPTWMRNTSLKPAQHENLSIFPCQTVTQSFWNNFSTSPVLFWIYRWHCQLFSQKRGLLQHSFVLLFFLSENEGNKSPKVTRFELKQQSATLFKVSSIGSSWFE